MRVLQQPLQVRLSVELLSSLLATTVLGAMVSGCTVNLVRNPREPEVLKERIAYFKWLHEQGLLKDDPALMKDLERALMGVGREHQTRNEAEENLEPLLRRLLEELEKARQEKGAPPKGSDGARRPSTWGEGGELGRPAPHHKPYRNGFGSMAGSDPSIGDIAYYAPWGNLALFYKDFGYSNGLITLGA
jgi:Cyclophilin-like family